MTSLASRVGSSSEVLRLGGISIKSKVRILLSANNWPGTEPGIGRCRPYMALHPRKKKIIRFFLYFLPIGPYPLKFLAPWPLPIPSSGSISDLGSCLQRNRVLPDPCSGPGFALFFVYIYCKPYRSYLYLSFCFRETKKYCGILQEAGKDSERIH
jgi:hypothetical protein